MGILDDAIREHLDLKRRHGAREAELQEIEDEAFGSSEQHDPFVAGSELFNEVSPAAEGATSVAEAESASTLSEPDIGGEEPTRLVEPEALRPTEDSPEDLELDLPDEPEAAPLEDLDQIPGQPELPGQDEIPGQERLEDAVEPPSPSESLEELIAEEEPFPEDSAAPPHAPETAEDEQVAPDTESAPEPPGSFAPEPPPPPPATGPEPPGRARGRVDVPTQEHPSPAQTGDLPPFPSEPPGPQADEPVDEALPAAEPEPAGEPGLEAGEPELYDFETDADPIPSGDAPADDDFEALGPAEEEAPYLDDERPYSDEPGSGDDVPLDEPSTAVRPALEDEEAYQGGGVDPEEGYEEEDDDLWFEKGPPKDFDFDD